MDSDEVAANAAQAQHRLANRAPVPVSVVEGSLVEATPVPALDEISPYREIMVAHEYELVRTLEGPAPPERFRVHHWGLLDADRQPLPATKPGDVARLQREPFAAHRHLQEIFPAEALALDLDIPVYLDVSP